jgi:hypothetical protein
VDIGHSRVPPPPDKITGVIVTSYLSSVNLRNRHDIAEVMQSVKYKNLFLFDHLQARYGITTLINVSYYCSTAMWAQAYRY